MGTKRNYNQAKIRQKYIRAILAGLRSHDETNAPELKSLFAVATINEIAKTWHIVYQTVYDAIQEERILARQSSKTWLVDVQSVIEWRGMPPKPRK